MPAVGEARNVSALFPLIRHAAGRRMFELGLANALSCSIRSDLHLARPSSGRWHDEAGSVDEVFDVTSKTSTATT
jgi:hypothetical protein